MKTTKSRQKIKDLKCPRCKSTNLKKWWKQFICECGFVLPKRIGTSNGTT